MKEYFDRKREENKRFHIGNLPINEKNFTKDWLYIQNISKLNPFLSFILIGIICCGLINLFSIEKTYFFKQLVFILISIPLFIFAVCINLRYVIKLSYILIFCSFVGLLVTLAFGDIALGARRWIDFKFFKIQPSEFVKPALIICLARYYHFVKEKETQTLKKAIMPILIISLIVLPVLKQPDLGSAMIIIFIGVSMIFLAGLQIRYFIIALVIVLLSLPLAWSKMHDYQKKRILTFLNPSEDPRGSSYNIIQSKITIGSGGFLGKGYGNSSQAKLDFLPENHTDFAFTVFAEQFGLIGVLILFSLFACLIFYSHFATMNAESHFIRLIASGYSLLLFCHFAINIGMVSGLLPVVGVPLPFISYGGTFCLINISMFGLLQNAIINKSSVIQTSTHSYASK